jgi:hypothetical protein
MVPLNDAVRLAAVDGIEHNGAVARVLSGGTGGVLKDGLLVAYISSQHTFFV